MEWKRTMSGCPCKVQPGGVAATILAQAPTFLLVAALWGGADLLQAAPPQETAEKGHPLDPAIELAEQGLKRIDSEIRDYTATLVKRERIGDKVGEQQFIFTKIRHEQRRGGKVIVPFSVYLKFLKPKELKGREVIYVRGWNDNKLMAHEPPGSATYFLVGRISLKPDGFLAMRGNRYPVTEIGIRNLVVRLLEVARQDRRYGECEVDFYKRAKINGRSCTKIEVRHPVRRKYFRFNVARIYIDDELQIPVRYEAYEWPEKPGGSPRLQEEYTYLNVKLNVGLTDRDFDPDNPRYKFP